MSDFSDKPRVSFALLATHWFSHRTVPYFGGPSVSLPRIRDVPDPLWFADTSVKIVDKRLYGVVIVMMWGCSNA